MSLELKGEEAAVREKMQREKEEIQETVRRVEAHKAEMEAEVLELRSTLEACRQVEQQQRAERDQLMGRLEEAVALKDEYQVRLTGLEQRLLTLQEKEEQTMIRLQTIEDGHAAELAILRRQLDQETELSAEKTAELEEVLVQGQQLATKVDSMDDEISRLQQELEEQGAKCQSAEARAQVAEALRVSNGEKADAEAMANAEQLATAVAQIEVAQSTASQLRLDLAAKQQELESLLAACRLHSEEIDNLKELLQEARLERGSQLQKSADKYHKLAILHDEVKEELKVEREKVAIGLREMEQLQQENQLVGPALGKKRLTLTTMWNQIH